MCDDINIDKCIIKPFKMYILVSFRLFCFFGTSWHNERIHSCREILIYISNLHSPLCLFRLHFQLFHDLLDDPWTVLEIVWIILDC